jgi:hypothetical protein
MKREIAGQVFTLLEQQAAGSVPAMERLRRLAVSHDDGGCLFNLYQEWQGAFSFAPGRPEVLPSILALARKIEAYRCDEPIRMYGEPEWTALVALRGPVETVMIRRCAGCLAQYAVMGVSGFYDARGLVCPRCGDVYFKSYDDEVPAPLCDCGGEYPDMKKWGCPVCSEKQASCVAVISPYEYFRTHKLRRGQGA